MLCRIVSLGSVRLLRTIMVSRSGSGLLIARRRLRSLGKCGSEIKASIESVAVKTDNGAYVGINTTAALETTC